MKSTPTNRVGARPPTFQDTGMNTILPPVNPKRRRAAAAPVAQLSVSGLRVQFPGANGLVDAVRDIEFDLEAGGTLAIVGEAGCGKTMLAISLLGMAPERAVVTGSQLLNGQQLVGAKEPAWQRLRGKQVAMVFQDAGSGLDPLRGIGVQVAEILRRHARFSAVEALEVVAELLRRAGIAQARERLNQHPHQFTATERQAIAVAMALVCQPDILIADEPMDGLDAGTTRQLVTLIASLVAERKMAFLLVTRDLGLAARSADQVLVMYGGCVVERGPTADVFSRPAHPYTKGLLAALPTLDIPRGARLATIPGNMPAPGGWPAGCPFADRCEWRLQVCRASLPALLVPLVPKVVAGHVARCIRMDVLAPPSAAHQTEENARQVVKPLESFMDRPLPSMGDSPETDASAEMIEWDDPPPPVPARALQGGDGTGTGTTVRTPERSPMALLPVAGKSAGAVSPAGTWPIEPHHPGTIDDYS